MAGEDLAEIEIGPLSAELRDRQLHGRRHCRNPVKAIEQGEQPKAVELSIEVLQCLFPLKIVPRDRRDLTTRFHKYRDSIGPVTLREM
jgi:hypothetical protein